MSNKYVAKKAALDIRKIDKNASIISKCLEGMPCDDCREQVAYGLKEALRDIEIEKCMARLAFSRLKMNEAQKC